MVAANRLERDHITAITAITEIHTQLPEFQNMMNTCSTVTHLLQDTLTDMQKPFSITYLGLRVYDNSHTNTHTYVRVYKQPTITHMGAWDGVVVKVGVLVGRSRDRFPVVSLDFLVTYFFQPFHGNGVDSASSENEYQEHFLGVKAAGA